MIEGTNCWQCPNILPLPNFFYSQKMKHLLPASHIGKLSTSSWSKTLNLLNHHQSSQLFLFVILLGKNSFRQNSELYFDLSRSFASTFFCGKKKRKKRKKTETLMMFSLFNMTFWYFFLFQSLFLLFSILYSLPLHIIYFIFVINVGDKVLYCLPSSYIFLLSRLLR